MVIAAALMLPTFLLYVSAKAVSKKEIPFVTNRLQAYV